MIKSHMAQLSISSTTLSVSLWWENAPSLLSTVPVKIVPTFGPVSILLRSVSPALNYVRRCLSNTHATVDCFDGLMSRMASRSTPVVHAVENDAFNLVSHQRTNPDGLLSCCL